MKWYQWLAIAIAGLFVARFFRGRPGVVPKTPEEKVAEHAAVEWPGGAGDINKIRLADQELYPGFYINEFGGYYNPETGDSYSPGSSPVVYRGPTAETVADQIAVGQAINEGFADAVGRVSGAPAWDPRNVIY